MRSLFLGIAGAIVTAVRCAAQTSGSFVPPVQDHWQGRESWPSVNADDEGRDIVFWQNPSDPGERWVFTTGYVTDASGKTRFATFRYDPDDNSSPVQVATKRAYYPPSTVSTEVNSKAVAIAVDFRGDVYVTGESENPTDGTMDVITIKYDKDLLQPPVTVPQTTFPWPNTGEGDGVRRYQGVFSAGPPAIYAQDVPTDITVNANAGTAVVIAATTETASTGKDLIAIAYDQDGNLHPAWGNLGDGAGVRKYDFGGDDRSCEIGGPVIASHEDGSALQVTVNGTSEDGASGDDDIVTLMFFNTGVFWSDRYGNGCGLDDTCTGLTFPGDQTLSVTANAFYTVGHTYECEEFPHPHDFVAIGYRDLGGSGGDLLWTDTIDFGADDYCADARVVFDGSNFRLCLTGYTKPSTTYSVATALYTHAAGVASVSLDWAVTYNPVSSRQHEGLGVAIRAVPSSTTVEEFITGLHRGDQREL